MIKTPRLSIFAVLAMTLLTGAYLSFEIPFGALLLEIVSNGSDAATISRLEQAGRLIAGAAFALAMLPFVIKRAARGDMPLGRVLRRAAIVSIAIIGIAFVAQRVLVDHIADRSSATERKAAVQALSIRAAFPSDLSNDPAGRAIAALAPLATFVRPAALSDAGGLPKLAAEQASRTVGDVSHLRSGAYAEGLAKARESYDAYRRAQDAMGPTNTTARNASAAAWQKWIKWINDRTWGLASREGIKSANDAAAYRRIARDQGVPVSDSWYPLDEAGFRAASERAFLDRISSQAGKAGLPSGLTTFDAFLRDPAVQAKMRGTIGPIAASLSAGENSDETTFRTRAMAPAIAAARDAILADASADASDYADGRVRANSGKSAVRAIAVPLIALLLSLIGLSVHVFKFANYGWMLLTAVSGYAAVRSPLRHAVILFVLAIGILALRDGGSTSTDFWKRSAPAISAHFGTTASAIATFVVQMQPGTYPASSRMASMSHFSGFAGWIHGPPGQTNVSTMTLASR